MRVAAKRESVATRGYSLPEMRRIEKEIAERRAEWLDCFDAYVELLLDHEHEPEDIVSRAERLADLRLEAVLRKQGQ